jgi:putative transposase
MTSSMTATTTKTLEATLAPPTAHKERKLCDLLETYREGLHEAFDAGCDTMSATSGRRPPGSAHQSSRRVRPLGGA